MKLVIMEIPVAIIWEKIYHTPNNSVIRYSTERFIPAEIELIKKNLMYLGPVFSFRFLLNVQRVLSMKLLLTAKRNPIKEAKR